MRGPGGLILIAFALNCGIFRVTTRLIPSGTAARGMVQRLHGGGDKIWVAGVEPAAAGEPAARQPGLGGCRPSGLDPSHPATVTRI
jgi:hypothetical protein